MKEMKFQIFIVFTLLLVIKNGINCEDLTEPHLIIIGATGTGKSSLANVLIGELPGCDDCTFPVCPGGDSCTKQTKYAVGPWLGTGFEYTIVDTPGFGDSDNDDNNLINEMVDVLKDVVKTANGFVLLFNGMSERFDTKAQQMLREFEALFGQGFWDHVVLGVSFWAYDQNSIQARNFSGKTESWWKDEMNSQLHEKFHLETDLEAVFIDSWAKQPWNLNDPLQQEAFGRETLKLWNIFSTSPTFEFKTIQDVIEENIRLKEENKWLNDVITNNISEIMDQLQDHSSTLEDHTKELEDLSETVDNLSSLPLGSIIPWINRPELDTIHHEEIPDGWLLCNGTVIPKGVWKGQKVPNLNGENRFLRGGDPHLVLTLEDHMVQDHGHVDDGHSHSYQDCGSELMTIDGHSFNAAAYMQCPTRITTKEYANIGGVKNANFGNETRPVNMRIIWIMKAW